MITELELILTRGLDELAGISDETGLESFRVGYLGKKGRLTALAAGMRNVPPDQKAAVGAKLNEVRSALDNGIDEKLAALQAVRDAAAVKGIDLTLPGRPVPGGALHPLTRLRDRAVQALRRMGFALADGPEIETEWHCFDALNTPADHPARNEKDTFYLPDGRLLRTHTSTVQIRTHGNREVPARPHHRAGRGLSPRRDRRHPPQRLQPARRTLCRPRRQPRRPQGHARILLPRTLRRRNRRCASARTSSPSPSRASRST